ncbi:MAG TPA: CsbD family protein [Oligoflexus sp.]|uniref:CsbD family protein n=1 Tax=Oligoflexus sp. TaxID=1971216 RepID=UPI002D5FA07B|nr:CsbD family protein [Oligoflexus sp.]HYX33736.1 CsbD family protein [Oligoflexus sp.]
MNWDQVEGQWKNIKGTIREKWAKFTDDDIELIAGKKDRMVGKLQERYGLAKENAEAELDQYIASMDSERRSSMS